MQLIPGYGDKYAITKDGRVWSLISEQWLSPYLKQGYFQTTLLGKGVLTHRLVALTYLDRPSEDKTCVLHKDGVKTNNHVNNLYWGTRADNYQDTVKHGTSPHGSRNGLSKLTQAEVDSIREGYATGLVIMSALGDLYGVSATTVCDIVNYKLWN